MDVLHDVSSEGKRVILRSGGFHLGLFVGIESNCVNFRGANVFAVHDTLKERFPSLVGEPESYRPNEVNGADAAGTSWLTRDPDENEIVFH
jgi:hypothetical protein